MRIGPVDLETRVLVVAEIGNNHEGDVALAERMVREAAGAGADAVKLQTFRTEAYVTPAETRRFDQLKRFELGDPAVARLADLARAAGVLFLTTPFDLESVDVVAPWVPAFKIASGDLTVPALLGRVAAKGKPMILSTGMAVPDEIEEALALIRAATPGPLVDRVALLHCVSSYPTPADQANLRSIPFLRERFGLTVGYSDHTLGTLAAVAAVALGARIVEKHFTYRREGQTFGDHQLSAEPAEFADMVRRIRQVERLRGAYDKVCQPAEEPVRQVARRSLAAARPLSRGATIDEDDLTWLRPATGIPPKDQARVVGRTLTRDIAAGAVLTWDDLGGVETGAG